MSAAKLGLCIWIASVGVGLFLNQSAQARSITAAPAELAALKQAEQKRLLRRVEAAQALGVRQLRYQSHPDRFVGQCEWDRRWHHCFENARGQWEIESGKWWLPNVIHQGATR